MGPRFEPIRYVLFEDGALSSNVQYSNPLLGRGWLSASGSIQPADASTLELHFDKFWWDGGTDTLRPLLGGGGGGDGQQFEDASLPQPSAADAAVTSLGRTGFVRQLALFPVLYVDEELAVFKFPPLDSNIAIHKVAPPARRPLRS